MLNSLKQTQQQWGGQSEVIDHWLDMRQDLLVSYYNLAVLKPNVLKGKMVKLPSALEIQDFCTLLVDYISEGHFRIYNQVMDKWQATGFQATEEIDQLYFKIIASTDPLLNFSDKYASLKPDDDVQNFEYDFSELGEIMCDRFELEDELIQIITDSLSIPPGA